MAARRWSFSVLVHAHDSCQQGHPQSHGEADGTEIQLVFRIVDAKVKFSGVAGQGVVNADRLAGLSLDVL